VDECKPLPKGKQRGRKGGGAATERGKGGKGAPGAGERGKAAAKERAEERARRPGVAGRRPT